MYLDYDDNESFTRSNDKRVCERKLGENIQKCFKAQRNKSNQKTMSIVDDTTPFNRIFNYCEAEDLAYTN